MQFRTDISFLRALSVVIVMFFHFQIFGFSGGFIGVDIFFVISGFLMTQIIIKNFDKGVFSLKEFYYKRIKRIMPALQFVLFFILLISAVFFFQSDLRLNAKYILLADFFVSNIYFWKYQDYFSSTDNILLHTWSLGVEWQFYLVYPIILLMIRRFYFKRKKIFWSILLGITILSFILASFISKNNVNFAFYTLPSRFWELSLGGLAFALSQVWKPIQMMKYLLVFLSLGIIILCNVLISENHLWPSILTLLPVLSTAIILTINIDISLFNDKLTKLFGDISYSLYLWHWPWFVLFKYFGLLGGTYTVLLIIISIASAYLSYRFVEKNNYFSSLIFILFSTFLITGLSLFFYIKPEKVKGLSIYQNKKFEIGNYQSEYLKSQKEKQFNPCHCFITNQQTIKDFDYQKCLKFSATKKNILLIGDSHAAQFSASFRELSQYNIMEVSAGYTFPLTISKGKKVMVNLMQSVFTDFIPTNSHRIDLVIISAHWLMRHNPEINYSSKEIIEKIKETTDFLQKNKIKFLIIGQSEAYEITYPKILMLQNFGEQESSFIKIEAKEINEVLKKEIDNQHYIDIYNSPEIKHFEQYKEMPYMFDGNHFTKYGADQIIEKLVLPRINEKFSK